MTKIARQGGEVVLVYGTLIRTELRSGKDNRKNYSGEHKTHGLLSRPVPGDALGLLSAEDGLLRRIRDLELP
ncbi:hypothetical protein [Nonomuraea angiospora]|uniref:hypothetical protein n=1 Tax=Nonomuraea angiospora TaxID=46172 RepID=UPI0029BB6EA7|nr:hypothetical protein [Nonomuraea angiospora]MDX3101334.1 hypothetical protein [Nonomuraea angiospora]